MDTAGYKEKKMMMITSVDVDDDDYVDVMILL